MQHAISPTAHASYPRLVADIGGSNARFGWLAEPGAPLSHVRKLAVPDFAGPAEAALAYLRELQASTAAPWRAPQHAALAVATAVADDHVRFTNSHWQFSRRGVQQALQLQSLLLLNDFEALALSLPCLTPAQWRAHGGQMPAGRAGLLAVVGPGTGLGVGAVVNTGRAWLALPGEGGHATLAPADELESALLGAVRRQFAHVSAERLLSGIGLPVLHQALGLVTGQVVPAPWTAEAIVNQGVAGSDSLCSQTIDLFCALLGGFAGNVALTLGARGGVYIGGGIVPRFADRFFASDFRKRFEAKGRFQAYLQDIPTALITDTLVALTGAALAIEQQVQAGQAAEALPG